MEHTTTITKIAAGHGLILGLILIGLQFIGTIVGLPLLFLPTYIAGIAYSAILYRERYMGGFITYGRSLKFGILVSGFTFIILGMFVYIWISLYPAEYRVALEAVVETMKARGFATQELVNTNPTTNPIIWIVTYLFMGVVAGLAVSAITSFFTKKQ
jgi:hypothetical protein